MGKKNAVLCETKEIYSIFNQLWQIFRHVKIFRLTYER